MSQISGQPKNLTEASDESLRALIQAVIPEAGNNGSNNLSGDAMNRLTEKLSELMGHQVVEGLEQNRNERGELLNEEGLPIIDITEPANDNLTQSIPPPITVEPLIPLANLPNPIQERLREKRNKILDALEEEERQAEQAERERDSIEKEENTRKRREEAAKEKNRLQQARELQKKMGRALLQDVGKAKQKEEQEKEAQRLRDQEEDQKRKSPSAKKKTVAFAGIPGQSDDAETGQSNRMDWGDITPARLQPSKRRTLLSPSLLDKHPMKMSVVERVPGGQPTIPKSPPPSQQNAPDSDDESSPEDSSEGSETDISDEEPILETDEVDYDLAQHQREIALEYYKKRSTIGQEAAKAMMNHSHDLDEDLIHDTPEQIRDTSKPVLSQFKASRLASAYSASAPKSVANVSTSLGASVLPVSSTRTIQHAIRTGKLDSDGQLIGAEDDSASEEEDQTMQEVLDLLKKGEIYNLGPNGEYVHVVPPKESAQKSSSKLNDAASVTPPPAVEYSQQFNAQPPNIQPKSSKFKASRASMGRPSTSQVNLPEFEVISPSPTLVSHAGRSSPKSVNSPDITESSTTITSPSQTVHQSSPFSMIVDSPSFPMPSEPGKQFLSATTTTTTTVPVVRPSNRTPSSRRSERPPTVVAASVLERKTAGTSRKPAITSNNQPEKKISRFKAERM